MPDVRRWISISAKPVVMLGFLVLSASAGCSMGERAVAQAAAVGENAGVEPSQLAGRWKVRLIDFVRAVGQEDSDTVEHLGELEMTLLTVKEDGSIDWSRSESSVFGSNCPVLSADGDVAMPCRIGETCVVTDSAYTADRSLLAFDRMGDARRVKSPPPGPSERVRIELIRVDDEHASLEYQLLGQNDVPKIDMACLLTRSSRRNPPFSEPSRLRGCWSPSPDGPDAAVLCFRDDGTMDWTGTLESTLLAWHELEQVGDTSFCRMDPRIHFEVTASEYEPTKSALTIRCENDLRGSYDLRCTAVVDSDDRLKVTTVSTAAGSHACKSVRTLYRCDVANNREERVFGALLEGDCDRRYYP